MILLSSVEGQLVRVDNVDNIDLVLVFCFALFKVIAITGDELHTILVPLLHLGTGKNQKAAFGLAEQHQLPKHLATYWQH